MRSCEKGVAMDTDSGTIPGGRWAIDTEGGHVIVSVSLIRNGYEYGRLSRGRFGIPHAIVAICL